MTHRENHHVSVVIPCYNGMPYLPEALDSALGQTHQPTQIIVVDDGSTDDSAQVVRDYAQRFPDRGVQLVQQTNAGESAARNTGTRAATGTWVAIFDADDRWEPTKLQKQLAAAEHAGPACVFVHTGERVHMPDGSTVDSDLNKGAQRTGWCTELLVEPFKIGHPTVLVRRDALNQIGGYDESLIHAVDLDVYLKLSVLGTFAFVPEYLLHYRIHQEQTGWKYPVQQVHAIHHVVRRFFKQHPDLADKIGTDRIEKGLVTLVDLKLESFYWQRRLKEFRQLLRYGLDQHGRDPAIRAWRRRGRVPDWLIRLKDRLSMVRS